jgi:hypothetical protein
VNSHFKTKSPDVGQTGPCEKLGVFSLKSLVFSVSTEEALQVLQDNNDNNAAFCS